MNNLDIKLIIDGKCQLAAFDKTEYVNLLGNAAISEDITDHISLEFLVYNEEVKHIEESVVIRRYSSINDLQSPTVMSFPKDGTFTYYKFLMPQLFELYKVDESSSTASFNIENELYYYDHNIYKGLKNLTNINIIENPEDYYNTIISSEYSELITNYYDLWEVVVDNPSSQTFSFQKKMFTVCKLQKCLVNLQRKMLENNRCYDSNTDLLIKNERDFLLCALYVFDYLKDTKNYTEAQRILDNLIACNELCNSDLTINTDCGCGSTK